MTTKPETQPLAWLVKNAPGSEGNDVPYTNWCPVKRLIDEGYEVVPLFAAHEPKQEPSVPVSSWQPIKTATPAGVILACWNNPAAEKEQK